MLTLLTLHCQQSDRAVHVCYIYTLALHTAGSADDRVTFTIIITSCTTVLAAPLSSALQTCVNNESIISLQHCSTAARRDGFPSARRTAPDHAAVERR